jgi:hypothetical protein
MARVTRVAPALLIALLGVCHGGPPRLPTLVDLVHSEFRDQEALEYVRGIWENDRWFTSRRFRLTAEYLKNELERLGATGVEIITAPADGATEVGFWTLPMAWDVDHARLEIVHPTLAPPLHRLADYASVPQSLCTWSGGDPEGLEAELLEWDAAAAADGRFRGKFVLTSRDPSNFKWALVRAGVAGVLNSFTENPDLIDGTHWISGWGDFGWPFLDSSTPLPCFSVTPRRASRLRQLLADGPVRLRAEARVRHYSGEQVYLTGMIPGSDSPQEVLMLGHTSEPGAQDNATGVAAMLESMAILRRLIDSGRLPPPRRTIRVLAMPEMFGSLHYVQSYPNRVRNTVAAICLDTPAGDYEAANTEYTFYLPPWVASSFSEAWLLRTAETYFSRHSRERKWNWRPFVSGTDNFLSDPLIGIPTIFPYSGSGIHTHHNSEDTPDHVDPRSLRDLVSVTAAWAYSLASARDEDLLTMAQAAAGHGMALISQTALDEMERVSVGTASLWDAPRPTPAGKVEFLAELQRRAVRSVLRLAEAPVNPEVQRRIEGLERSLGEFAALQTELLERHLGGPSSDLRGPASATVAADIPPEASYVIVRRKRFGTIPLDRLAPEKREGFSPALFEGPAVIALWWCDGMLPLSEVIRRTEWELGPTGFDYVGYFRFLERQGFVEFVGRAPNGDR